MTEARAAYRTARTDAARQIAKLRREQWELALLDQIHIAGLPEPERQYKFHPVRQWLND